jgi:uncharacterized membrane protein
VTGLAHIAGMPVEETVASFGPVLLVAGGGFVAALRARLARMRRSSFHKGAAVSNGADPYVER